MWLPVPVLLVQKQGPLVTAARLFESVDNYGCAANSLLAKARHLRAVQRSVMGLTAH